MFAPEFAREIRPLFVGSLIRTASFVPISGVGQTTGQFEGVIGVRKRAREREYLKIGSLTLDTNPVESSKRTLPSRRHWSRERPSFDRGRSACRDRRASSPSSEISYAARSVTRSPVCSPARERRPADAAVGAAALVVLRAPRTAGAGDRVVRRDPRPDAGAVGLPPPRTEPGITGRYAGVSRIARRTRMRHRPPTLTSSSS